MKRIHDLICKCCSNVEENVIVEGLKYPRCPKCKGERDWFPSKVNTDVWGGPRYVSSLDKKFDNVSDLRKHMKENDLGPHPSAEKHHGSRSEHGIKGTIFPKDL